MESYPALNSLHLIDAAPPFFRGYKRSRVNWSKIPWEHLPCYGVAKREHFDCIQEDLRVFSKQVEEVGYNALMFDDLPHLADHEWLEAEIRERIAVYREEFRVLFEISRESGLAIFVTMDVMSLTPALAEKINGSEKRANAFLAELIDQFFVDFPEVQGLILRIGESDGLDIKGDFRSELTLKNPAMVNRFLHDLLPVFEKHGRRCIFRTWTVGAHQVGDLIWREFTLERMLKNVDSPALILSMKYGESDFFRYLPLNRNFFVTDVPKIVEVQTRREYEGAGEYPSFTGWDYERYYEELADAPNVIGHSNWCNTGGWHPFRRLSFLDDGAVWTELNSFVTLRIFRYGETVEEAIRQWPLVPTGKRSELLELLRLSDQVVKELLYIEDFASQNLFFRRVRIPPLLGVYWHNIFVSHAVKKVLSHFVEDGEASIRQGYQALTKIDRMRELAAECELPVEDIDFMRDTFAILALAREYFFRPYTEDIKKRLKKAKRTYKKRYPRGSRFRYAIKLDFTPVKLRGRHVAWFFNYLARGERQYRFVDRIVTIQLMSWFYWVLKRARPKMMPKFARKSAMGIDAIFK